jgi:hypothetical protein
VGSGGGESWRVLTNFLIPHKFSTYFWISRATMNCSNLGRRIWGSPNWFWQVVSLFLFTFFEQIFDWTWNLFQLLRYLEKVHLIVLVSDFIRQTTSPRFDFIDFMLFLVIAGLTNIDFFVFRKPAWPAFVESSKKHDETTINYLINWVVSILPSFHNFILKEVFVESMNSLLRSIIPACIYPFGTILILVSAVDLSNNWLC